MFRTSRSTHTPHVFHLAVARYEPSLPSAGGPLAFLVTLHEEGTGVSWRQEVVLGPEDREAFVADARRLERLGQGAPAAASDEPRELALDIGRRLFDRFVGDAGARHLDRAPPTAWLLDVDETVMDLPWELLARGDERLAEVVPFGRIVGTRTIPKPGRDPGDENDVVEILAVANPTGDLGSSEAEVGAIEALAGPHGDVRVEVTTVDGRDATAARLSELVAERPFDILHFAGHGAFDEDAPGGTALRLADGPLDADAVRALPFRKPPYFVLGSACESARAAGGRRLTSAGHESNGLAAAFLSLGVEAFAGFVWPVSDTGAALFAATFYRALFRRENVGLAFLDARLRARDELELIGDLTGLSAVLYGDAGSAHRRDP